MLDRLPRPNLDSQDILRYLLLILVCAAAFTIIGTLLPVLVHQHAPAENYIEVTEFHAENVTTADESQQILIQRSVTYPTRGDVLLQLVLVHNETAQHVSTHYETTYFSEGDQTRLITRPLPADLREGSYYYALHIEFTVEGVDRELYARSNTFHVDAPRPVNETITTVSGNNTTTTPS